MLVRHRTRLAFIDGDLRVTFAELAERVVGRSAELALPDRSLVVLSGDNSLQFVVTYLALLRDGHVPLLAGDHSDDLARVWAATAVVHAHRNDVQIDRRTDAAPMLHPGLALLLSTSGSTGSPKLVRLSHDNLVSNARAIGSYLSLTHDDRSVTSLPLTYCYGLSVLHSHLLAGASMVLIDASVVDPCFRDAIQRHRVTNFAGVPHTFELLERSGFQPHSYPALRFMTQAGGKMAATRVQSWALALEQHGAELFVMYGQTEATARMTFLPPALAQRCPGAIGVPIPGGSIELRPHPAAESPDVGQIVYSGPNVMMGYAERVHDLAQGQRLHELATGDLGRWRPDEGVFEIVGRASRFVKPFGLRIDLDRVERALTDAGWQVAVAGDDDRVVVAVVGHDSASLHRAVIGLTGLPNGSVCVVASDVLPRTDVGKLDHAAVRALAPVTTGASQHPSTLDASVSSVFAEVLGREHIDPADSFASLGGDSLSYIECGLRLESLLGRLPDDWHVVPVGRLAGAGPRCCVARMDVTIVLRAVAICTVVATHMRLIRFPGGAHLLLAIAGYNLARFQLTVVSATERLRAGLRTALRVGAPASIWIGLNMLIAGGYSLGALALVNDYSGSPWRREGRWQYWFVEVFVQLLVITSLLLSIPAVRRFERRAQFLFPLMLLLPCLAFRFRWLDLGDHYNYMFRTHTVAWFFMIGWAVERARRHWQRLLMMAVVMWAVPDFFESPRREWFIIGGVLAMIWLPTLPVPRMLHRPIAAVASASMWIFLVHWQVWPPLDRVLPRQQAYVSTVVIGVAVWWLVGHWRAIAAVTKGYTLRSLERAYVGLRQQAKIACEQEESAWHRPNSPSPTSKAHAIASRWPSD